MIYKLFGRHYDLSKLIELSDAYSQDVEFAAEYIFFTMSFQLMDEQLERSVAFDDGESRSQALLRVQGELDKMREAWESLGK